MNYKDTIIMQSGNRQSIEIYTDALLSEQAEVSFQAGIKEVVGWVELNNDAAWVFSKADGSEAEPTEIKMKWNKWQNKLKERGIND